MQTATGWDITLSAQRLSLFSTIFADQQRRFSENAVLVLPGAPVVIGFAPLAGKTPTFTCQDLHGATYGTT